MGWASGGQIFDLVAGALIEAGADDDLLGRVCYQLAEALTAQDWDTVDESVDAFRGHPAVTNALRRANRRNYIDAEPYEADAILDYDQHADEWVLHIGADEAGRAPGTAEGHDLLVEMWFDAGPATAARRHTVAQMRLS